jgi:hypothetical protein
VANDDLNLTAPFGAQLPEPPDADPHVLAVWQGRAGDRFPYADCAEHARELGGASPLRSLVEVKS